MIKKSRRERYKVRDDVVEATGVEPMGSGSWIKEKVCTSCEIQTLVGVTGVEPMGKGPLYASLSRTAD